MYILPRRSVDRSLWCSDTCLCLHDVLSNHVLQAEILASYKPTINTTTLIANLKQIQSMAANALEYFKSTRHMILFYEDIIKNQTVRYLHILLYPWYFSSLVRKLVFYVHFLPSFHRCWMMCKISWKFQEWISIVVKWRYTRRHCLCKLRIGVMLKRH